MYGTVRCPVRTRTFCSSKLTRFDASSVDPKDVDCRPISTVDNSLSIKWPSTLLSLSLNSYFTDTTREVSFGEREWGEERTRRSASFAEDKLTTAQKNTWIAEGQLSSGAGYPGPQEQCTVAIQLHQTYSSQSRVKKPREWSLRDAILFQGKYPALMFQ